jgi:hypothetical protein
MMNQRRLGLKKFQKFGHSDGNWSKMKYLMYLFFRKNRSKCPKIGFRLSERCQKSIQIIHRSIGPAN